ncbi:hypothetical protein AAFF_G00143170 [Aldrovandia affinis]|uniref:Uncharacterized protein n=1 Tax=Aldrovandia affinis TaxID=143900 RepID=A0AAD7WWY2_9TELE|nr:hypothetical protein AAFF_G00143170 [Aldrovandia affinis]
MPLALVLIKAFTHEPPCLLRSPVVVFILQSVRCFHAIHSCPNPKLAAKPAEVVLFLPTGPHQLVRRLLQQPGRTRPSVARGSQGLPCLLSLPRLTLDLGTAGRRSHPCQSRCGCVSTSLRRPIPCHNKSPLRLSINISSVPPLYLHFIPCRAF